MAELKKQFTTKTLLEQIPTEMLWAVSAKLQIKFSILRGTKTEMPHLGKDEGIIAPVWGLEKFEEIATKLLIESNKRFIPWVKDTFKLPAENALDVAKLCMFIAWLDSGPGQMFEFAEKTKERVLLRTTKCYWWEIYKDLGVDPGLVTCPTWCPALWEAGIKAVNPKIIYKFTKFMPRGDPYCEEIFELKEE